ncbi:unnamed protein product [Camellia sinensis]
MGAHAAPFVRAPPPPPPTTTTTLLNLLWLNLLLLLLFFSSTTLGDAESDANALIKFKSSLSNADALRSWNINNNNNDPKTMSPCSGNYGNWIGVLCSEGYIWGLQLENMALAGDIDVDSLLLLPHLRTISFMNNNFEGGLPDFKKLGSLKSLFLSHNHFSGQIPDDAFTGMGSLKKLYLSHNEFTGTIPSSVAHPNKLLELRLDGNRFTGAIPDLQQKDLKILNVSNNELEGPIPPTLAKLNPTSFSGNKDLCGKPLDLECKSPAVPSDPQKSSPMKIILIVICCLVALAAIIMVLIIYRRSSMTPQLGSSSSLKATGLPVPAAVVVAEQQQYGSSPDMSVSGNSKRGDQHGKLSFVRDDRQRFDLQDLLRASAEVLGSGNFGSSYKAVLMDGHAVVVKRFKHMNNCGREEFHEHMRRLGRLGHPNLLPLVAYYYRKEEKLLVFDYVHHGSLASHLHGNHSAEQPGLDWATRLKIVKGVARGLFYLHEELPSLIVPHGHLKSSNVLLDESMEPLLMDYTLVPVVNLERAQQIMVAYKSPEYAQQGRTTRKTDVWSLGILILEILTGKFPANYLIAQSGTDAAELTSWVDSIAKEDTARVFDKEMGTKNNNNNIDGHDQVGEMLKLLKIGVACCEEDAAKRWDLKEVLQKIEELN